VEQSFGGIDCASCADFVQKKLTTNPGIQSVQVDRKKGLLTVDLKPGNTVKLRQIRDLVQQSGFTPKDLRVTVIGTPVIDRGYTNFKIEGQPEMIRVRDKETYLRELGNRKSRVEAVIETATVDGNRMDFLVPTKADAAK
jgi:copper chaperone CopZ